MGAEREAAEILTLDRRIAELRSELNGLITQRSQLVSRLGAALGPLQPGRPVRIGTSLGTLEAVPTRRVGFPTQQEPRARDELIASLRRHGGYEAYSTLCYSRLKGDWSNRRVDPALIPVLKPFARESVELVIRSSGGRNAPGIADAPARAGTRSQERARA